MSDENDPQKYIFRRTDFRRVPRWENDGIAKNKREMEAENGDAPSRQAIRSATRKKRDLAELLGNWVYNSNMDFDGGAFLLGLPFGMQEREAQEQQNLPKAKEHLIENRKDPKVAEILEDIGYHKVLYKAANDPRRFPAWNSLLAALLQKNWGSDANLRLLFGDISYIRGSLLEVGCMVAEPPPFGSPAYAMWNPILEQNSATRVQPCCGYCQKKEEQKPFAKCGACRFIMYCSRECQQKDWPVHRPDCLEKQGKPVPDRVREKADATLLQWKQEAEEKDRKQQEAYMANLKTIWDAYCAEEPSEIEWSHDCDGRPRCLDLPPEDGKNVLKLISGSLADLKFEQDLELGMFPEGMDEETETRGVGILVSTRDTNAKILIIYDPLFADQGNGRCTGLTVTGVWVVDRSIRKTESGKSVHKAVWKEIPHPPVGNSCNRCERVAARLEMAKAHAKAMPGHVDLGIHDTKEMFNSMEQVETQFGTYMKFNA